MLPGSDESRKYHRPGTDSPDRAHPPRQLSGTRRCQPRMNTLAFGVEGDRWATANPRQRTTVPETGIIADALISRTRTGHERL